MLFDITEKFAVKMGRRGGGDDGGDGGGGGGGGMGMACYIYLILPLLQVL